MKSKALGAVGSLIAISALFLAPACGGSDPDPISNGGDDAGADTSTTDTGAAGDSSTGGGECTGNADCEAKLPTTTPANCAVATCDILQKKCLFKAKDSDGDGHAAKACTAPTATIETGDDCDDADKNTYPGAWDGPATDFDAGAGVQSDRCDQKDNDCNGSPDDGKIKVDGGDKTCKCDPNAPLPCYEYANGTPIPASTLDSNNNPKGMCKKGTRTCVGGVPSACSGAVGPEPTEQCDTIDHDCDGMSGNAGDTVPTATVWYKDGDNDNYGDMNTAAVQQCVAPPGIWKALIPNTDCDDGDAQRNPGLVEVCDNKDNNCNIAIDEGVKTNFCADEDSDTYCTAVCVQACVAPTGYRAQNTCAAGTDCNDNAVNGGASVHPGAADLCGDGVDSNCVGGDNEQYPTLGQACTAGSFGICKRTGTMACTLPARTSTTCNATAALPEASGEVPKNDALIDMSQARPGYDPRWDYNCDNVQEVIVNANEPFMSNASPHFFQSRACNGNYTLACAGLTETECGQGVFGLKRFTCDQTGGQYIAPTNPLVCGKVERSINCFFQFSNSTCTYNNGSINTNWGLVSCR